MGSRLVSRGGGIRLRRRFARVFRTHRKLNRVVTAVRRWGEKLRRRFGPGSSYVRLERVRDDRGAAVPKGHVAVYVAEEEAAVVESVVVPVIYVNHPLFGRLLREAEAEYGFDYPGGITLPCHVSEFESIQSMIAARRKWKSSQSGWLNSDSG